MQLQERLKSTLLKACNALYPGMALLYLVLVVGHLLYLESTPQLIMGTMAGLTSIFCLVITIFLRLNKIPVKYAEVLSGFIALIIIVNATTHLMVTKDIHQSVLFMLTLIGTPFLFISRWWYISMVITCYVCWGTFIIIEDFPEHTVHYAFALGMSTFASVFFYYLRIKTVTTLEVINYELEDKNRELEEALENNRTLRGLLPICAHCKKIRDDKGFWRQVEVYITEHTEIDFSHSICPDCLHVHYPRGKRS